MSKITFLSKDFVEKGFKLSSDWRLYSNMFEAFLLRKYLVNLSKNKLLIKSQPARTFLQKCQQKAFDKKEKFSRLFPPTGFERWQQQKTVSDISEMTNDNEASRKLIYLSFNCEICCSFRSFSFCIFARISWNIKILKAQANGENKKIKLSADIFMCFTFYGLQENSFCLSLFFISRTAFERAVYGFSETRLLVKKYPRKSAPT